MVASKVLFPAAKSHRMDVELPRGVDYWFQAWEVHSDGISEGRLILGIDNRTGDGFGTEAVRVLVMVQIAEDIPVRVELYDWPDHPTFAVPAGEIGTFEVASFLEGCGLDLSQCAGIGITLESGGGPAKTRAHVYVGFAAELVWIGEAY